MNYCAQSDIETYLDISLTANGQALFALLLPSMQDMIDQYCNRSWNITNPITQNFDALQETTSPQANSTFIVDYPPIASIDAVTVGGVPWDLQYVYNYKTYVKLWVRPQTIVLPNPLGFLSVVITYHSGAAGVVPSPIKLALIEWLARKIQTSPDANKEVTRTQVGTVMAQYAADKVGGIPDFVKLVLDQYRLPPVDHF